jgi:hypothetical protein
VQEFVLCAPQSQFSQYRVASSCSALCLVHFLYVCEGLQVGTRAPWAVPWGLTPCLPGSLASYNMLDSACVFVVLFVHVGCTVCLTSRFVLPTHVLH